MPELPEVEATRQNLARWTRGAGPIVRVSVYDPKLEVAADQLVGKTLARIDRRGKQLALIASDDHDRVVLATHLGMTGKYVRLGVDDHDRPYQRMLIAWADVTLAFVDPRRFGDAKTHAPEVDVFTGLGPDALDAPLPASALQAAMGRGRTPIKTRLLEQRRVAGLGNIAVCEACHRARIHPHTPVSDVPAEAWQRLPRAIRDHLTQTLADTAAVDEIAYLSEGAISEFLVYGKADLPCSRCRTAIITRDVLAQRPSFFCPRCQPLQNPEVA